MGWIFEEPVSHMGVGFEIDGVLPIVVDCTKPYGKVRHLNHWINHYDIVYCADISMTPEDEIIALKLACDNAVLKPYDWPAYYYGFLCGILKKLFKTPLPKVNMYSSKDKDLCSEVLSPIKPLLTTYGINLAYKDLSCMTPHMIGVELYNQTKNNKKVTWHDFPTKKAGAKH